MSPVVPVIPEFAHQASLGVTKGMSKHIVPGIPHEFEKRTRIPLGKGFAHVQTVIAEESKIFLLRPITVMVSEFPFNVGT
jgi:hypothetical protein